MGKVHEGLSVGLEGAWSISLVTSHGVHFEAPEPPPIPPPAPLW